VQWGDPDQGQNTLGTARDQFEKHLNWGNAARRVERTEQPPPLKLSGTTLSTTPRDVQWGSQDQKQKPLGTARYKFKNHLSLVALRDVWRELNMGGAPPENDKNLGAPCDIPGNNALWQAVRDVRRPTEQESTDQWGWD
jgi:hypothetical protein